VHSAAACQNHPEREAIGICVKCRNRVCSECVTKVDGINYCVACLHWLAQMGGEQKRQEAAPTGTALAVVSALGMLLLLVLMTWAMVEATMPGSG